MKVPACERAFVDVQKLHDYCLNPTHPRGRHKARVFLAALGPRQVDAIILRGYLEHAAQTYVARQDESDEFGDRYIIDFDCFHTGRLAVVRSGWIVLRCEDFPRLTTCFVL